ncbi:MAG: DNA-protecting protein DprA [Candidatus Kaiserbacteria bacterium]|nr:DNA-protecting protein DprA [Candidatus Kaiserbacteria bacterium]
MEHPIQTIPRHAYPLPLREIPHPPQQLYLRGREPDWSRHLIAVVGARVHSPYGKRVCEHIVSGLTPYRVTIVSGLAIGLDTVAHEAALQADIPTIAIPGSGLADTVLYPKRNRALTERMLAAGGTLLSELSPDTPATKSAFPARNRIIVGISSAVVAVECAERAGTQITAHLAVEYNRELGAVPHDIFSATGAGTNSLIARGAQVVRSGEDVAAMLGLTKEL